jgi:uncharacterized protein (TIGR02996 family)
MKRRANERATLLAAVCNDPENDTPRLAFADWLDAHGQSGWAAVIRKQIAGSKLVQEAPQFVREQCCHLPENTPEVRREATRSLPRDLCCQFERGFPGWLEINAQKFRAHADQLFRAIPVTTVQLGDLRSADVGWLTASPHLALLRRLALRCYSLDAASLQKLGESPNALGLRSLRLSEGYSGASAVLTLLKTPLFAQLHEFTFYWGFGGHPGDKFAEAFARLGPIPLIALRLVCLTAAGVVQLVRARAAGSLTALKLIGIPVNPEAVRALSTSPQLAGLRSLSARETITQLSSMKTLLKAPVWRLRHLDLSKGKIGPQAVKLLTTSPATAELTALELRDNPVGDGGAKILAESPTSARLRFLDLVDCKIGDAGGRALAESPYLDGIAELQLFCNDFTDPVRKALLARFGDRVSPDWLVVQNIQWSPDDPKE